MSGGNSELKPCPFCESDDVASILQATATAADRWHGFCRQCGSRGRGEFGQDAAIAAWNTRTDKAAEELGGGGMTEQAKPLSVEEIKVKLARPRARFAADVRADMDALFVAVDALQAQLQKAEAVAKAAIHFREMKDTKHQWKNDWSREEIIAWIKRSGYAWIALCEALATWEEEI